MAAGDGKLAVIARVFDNDKSLPITQAASTIELAGGHVTWLLDEAARPVDQ
jgi:hypothetical protein